MAQLEVIKMGNPLLRRSSLEVKENMLSVDFQVFLVNLIDTMHAFNGVGISAPQVGVLKRVFTMEMKNNSRYPNRSPFPLQVVINPEIQFLGNELVDSWEGCLSIPNIRGRLKRYNHIKLIGFNEKGVRFNMELKGFPAIVAQHEVDHLNGILLIDRMDSMETLTFQQEYEKYWL